MSLTDTDTICAIATPPGRSGVGIIRVSGPLSRRIAGSILGFEPYPRHAHYANFLAPHASNSETSRAVIDQGIALFFPAPHSFTGEDVLELQGHGGHFVLDTLLKTLIAAGARHARPGEFSERAFLNDKLDLTQAEAIADLIDCSSEQAARSALRTLQGEFSRLVRELADQIIELRVYIEAAIDFSEEEIDFLTEGKTAESLARILDRLDEVQQQARQGAILKEGMSVVIAGKPNAGKSSLLNALAGRDSAIVTEIAGTTRDTLIEHINIDGMPLHITDTAGIQPSEDVVEKEGIRRAMKAIREADQILLVVDSSVEQVDEHNLAAYLSGIGFSGTGIDTDRVTVIQNKIDLTDGSSRADTPREEKPMSPADGVNVLRLSAKNHQGIDALRDHLKQVMGFQATTEGGFIARNRHLEALKQARDCLIQAQQQLEGSREGELVAEDLRYAHRYLGEITGEFTSDDLLGKIFSSFCVGK